MTTAWRKLHRNVLDYGYARTLAKSAAFAARPIYHRAVYPLDSDRELRELIGRKFGADTEIAWHYVADIEPEPSGKVPVVRFEK